MARPRVARGQRAAGAFITLVAASAAMAGAAPAQATSVQRAFAKFSDCPVSALGEHGFCIVSTVTSGEFAIGSKKVPINKTVTLQGGLEGTTLVPAADGDTLSKTPLQLPGGLAGIELLPPLTEVTATAELAGQASVSIENTLSAHGTAVSLPVVVKLDNPFLGSSCYIGSPSEPLDLNLTTGTTSPPAPNHPISGSPGTPLFGAGAPGIIEQSGVSLVDNAFAAPGVNGCGGALAPVIDPAMDIDAGLPAAAGHNTAIMNGAVLLASATLVKGWAALPELGRCSRVPFEIEEKEKVYHGGWLTPTCALESAGGKFGEYEWYEGPGAGNKFTVAAGATTLETKSGATLACAKGTGSGEYAGAKASTLTLKLTGCKFGAGKLKCTSAGAAAGEIVTGPLSGKLGFIEDRSVENTLELSVGVDISAPAALFTAECGGQKLSVTGSAIGVLTPLQQMSKSFTLQFSRAGGAQQPESFEEEPADTLSLSLGGGTPEAAGLSAKVKLANEEKLSVKSNV